MDEPKGKTTVPNNMGALIALQIGNNYKNEAISNINDNMKKRVDFNDGNVITINNRDDIENILIVRNKISKFISSFDFDALNKIKLTYASYYTNLLNKKYDKDVSNPNIDVEIIISDLKNKLQKYKFSMNESLFRKIVDEYVCSFLSLDKSFFDKYHNELNYNIKPTKDILDAKEGEVSVPIKLENKVDDKATLGVECISTNQLDNKANDNIALFENIAIYKGETNIIYSESGVGKTYFSIEVAKNENIKKPLFILLEDPSGKQAIRYTHNLSNKEFELFNLKDFDETFDEELAKIKQQADNEILKDLVFPNYHHYKILKRKNYLDMGCIDKKKINWTG